MLINKKNLVHISKAEKIQQDALECFRDLFVSVKKGTDPFKETDDVC